MPKFFVVNHPFTKQLLLLLFPLSISIWISIDTSAGMSIGMAINVAVSICGLVMAAKPAGSVCLVRHI